MYGALGTDRFETWCRFHILGQKQFLFNYFSVPPRLVPTSVAVSLGCSSSWVYRVRSRMGVWPSVSDHGIVTEAGDRPQDREHRAYSLD